MLTLNRSKQKLGASNDSQIIQVVRGELFSSPGLLAASPSLFLSCLSFPPVRSQGRSTRKVGFTWSQSGRVDEDKPVPEE